MVGSLKLHFGEAAGRRPLGALKHTFYTCGEKGELMANRDHGMVSLTTKKVYAYMWMCAVSHLSLLMIYFAHFWPRCSC